MVVEASPRLKSLPEPKRAQAPSEITSAVAAIIGDAFFPAPVIYGYAGSGYQHVHSELEADISRKISPLVDCYNWSKLDFPAESGFKIDGEKLIQSPHQCLYKRGLLSILLENCKRKIKGLPIIPVIFCVLSSLTPLPFSAQNAKKNTVTPTAAPQRSATGRELNIAYKLCYDPRLTPLIHEVAKETFIFVRTIAERFRGRAPFTLEDTGIRIDDSWHAALKKDHHKERDPAKHDWRAWMLSELEKFAGGSHG
jgi:hypothetical protein